MCHYENVTQEFSSCGHEIQRPGVIPIQECEQYLRRLQRYRKADKKWREGSQERCPPTPFNMHSCPTRVVKPERVFRKVAGLCWQCEATTKSCEVPRLRVEVREWKDYRDDSWRGLTPESEAGTSYDDDFDFNTDGLSPMSPPVSSSEADSEEMEDERFGSNATIPQSLAVDTVPTPRRSPRLAERTNQSPSLETTTRGRGRQRVQ